MAREEIEKRMKYLVREIKRHQDLYYRKAQPEISDSEYDALFDELMTLEKRYPDLALPDSPTKRIGSDLDNEFPEVRHPYPMLSLDKVYSIDEIKSWIAKVRHDSENDISFTIEEKIDGSTIVLHYENGILARAVTRGDGFIGNDITENVRTIRDIPLSLTEPITSIFRGEIYIDREDFKRLNSEFDNIYANPRNFSAGSLRRKKSSEVAKIPFKSYVYEGFYGYPVVIEHIKVIHRLSALGFRVFEDIGFISSNNNRKYDDIFENHKGWVRGGLNNIDNFIERMKKVRETIPYDIDGLVVKINEYPVREKLGYTAHHPRWAMAFKFEAPQAVSEILDIDVQVGRTGRITPVARVKPVWISGTTVSNVTLHNQDYINSLDIAIGDKVAVSRHGDVIPAVDEVIEKNDRGNKTFKLPDKCPVCGTELVQEGAHLFCPNRDCPARIYGRISFFVGRGQMDIENLGPETVKRLIKLDLIKDIPDIYFFNSDKLLNVDGFGEKKVQLIKEGTDKSKEQPFDVVLAALGLDEIGPKVVELLINAGYESIDKIIETAKKADTDIFTRIHGIGPKTAQKIIQQFNDPYILNMIERLKDAGLKFYKEKEGEKEEYPKVFEGEVWCVTGSFENFKPREKAMEDVKKRGGKVVSQVTEKTTHLLVGENPGSKLKKAKQAGVRLVNEDEFLQMLKLD